MNLTKEDPTDLPYQYISMRDLNILGDLQDRMLVAVKSPSGSRCNINIPKPDNEVSVI